MHPLTPYCGLHLGESPDCHHPSCLPYPNQQMGTLDATRRASLLSSLLHLVNREYGRLAADMVALGLLPPGSDMDAVVPALAGAVVQMEACGAPTWSWKCVTLCDVMCVTMCALVCSCVCELCSPLPSLLAVQTSPHSPQHQEHHVNCPFHFPRSLPLPRRV